MKIKMTMDTGANIHSKVSEVIDLGDFFGCSGEEAKALWNEMSDKEKHDEVMAWALEKGLFIDHEELV